MKKPVLVIMAAGLGSRYGGLKQIDPVDAEGHIIIDFSIYDAIKAGFQEIIFIIKQEMEQEFKQVIGNRISEKVKVQYAYQQLDNIPKGYSVPDGRGKPWGTGHAVLSCLSQLKGPFAVINADDYYGTHAFSVIYDFLASLGDNEEYHYAMVGYELEKTLTEFGHVSRGITEITEDGFLKEITERTRIEKHGAAAEYTEDNGTTWIPIPSGCVVSMNLWGFGSSILTDLEKGFRTFLNKEAAQNPLKAEFYLPMAVGELLKTGKATVKVLKSEDKWYGITYKEDKAAVVQAIAELKHNGIYPDKF
jgi:hypothetical protein